MTVTELMEKIQSEMTGDYKEDIKHLDAMTATLKKEENAAELVAAVAEYAFSLLPEEEQRAFEEQTMLDGKRLDRVFGEALTLVSDKKMAEAEKILAAISEKIAQYYESDSPKYFSFRNPFEYHMYRYYYPNDKEFDRAPFDFAHYLELYGFVLLENKKVRAAGEALERAIRFNPVSADVRFEMAELCKFAHDQRKLLAVNQDTLRLCTSADRIARVLSNMGYYCYVASEFYDAAVFYYESLRFHNNKAVEFELQDVLRRMKTFGQKFAPPTHGQTIDVYEKYGLQVPPNSELVNLAITLGNSAHEYGRLDLEGLFIRVAVDLTNDPQLRERLMQVDRAYGEQQG